MFVERLSLVDFRNYEQAEVRLDRGATVVVGRNGQGKTNLVEAFAFLATGSSHRVATDAALVRAGCDYAIVRARLGHGDRRLELQTRIARSGPNRITAGGSPVRAAELPRYARVVVFAPEDLQIVRGEPAARRRFADELVAQRSPRLSAVLADYDRVLRQRNALLKSSRGLGDAALGTLDVWDEKLVALGSQIIDARAALAAQLQPLVAGAYAQIAGADHAPALTWSTTIDGADPEDDPDAVGRERGEPTPAAFRRALESRRRAERDRGATLVGPHRDDLLVSVRGLPVRGYASHGESWSMALALRLASAELLAAESALGDPVVILDDVFAELDADRRDRLGALVARFEQVLVTAAVEADVPETLRDRILRVEGGRIDAGGADDDGGA